MALPPVNALPPKNEPHCLVCQEHMDYAQLLLEDVEIRDRRIRQLERKLYRLEKAGEDSAAKTTTSIVAETKVFLEAWNEYRKLHFPMSRTVNIDPHGSRGQRYQKARKMYSAEELLACLHGVELSPWHTSQPEYFELKSFLKEDERIEKHTQRYKDYQRLRDAGWDDSRARALIHSGIDKEARAESARFTGRDRCPGCGEDPCACDAIVQAEVIRKVA